jgi:hypothetical protein
MPDFVTRLAQRGAGLRPSAAPQPTAVPWASARLAGPADIIMESEPSAAGHLQPYGSAAPRHSILGEGPPASAPEAATELAVVAETGRQPTPVPLLARDPPFVLPASSSLGDLSPPPARTTAALSRDDPALELTSPVAKAAPAMRYLATDIAQAEISAATIARSEAQANLPPGNPPASLAPQPPSPADAIVSAHPRNRPVPVLALPQATRPAVAAMPEAATLEQRPIQVRIGRVEVRAAPAASTAAVPGPRAANVGGQGFGAMQLARSWLGRSFY